MKMGLFGPPLAVRGGVGRWSPAAPPVITLVTVSVHPPCPPARHGDRSTLFWRLLYCFVWNARPLFQESPRSSRLHTECFGQTRVVREDAAQRHRGTGPFAGSGLNAFF